MGVFGRVRMPNFRVDIWAQMCIHMSGIFGRADCARCVPIYCVNFGCQCDTCGHMFEGDLWAFRSSGGGCAKMGAPTMRHPCPGHVDMPIFAHPLPTKLFAHELRFTRQVFQKFLAKMFGNQSVTSIYLQCPKSRSAGVEITTISSLK